MLVDANLLFVRSVAALDRGLLSHIKGAKEYIPDDATLIDEFLGRFRRTYVTPNSLTEASNLASRCGPRATEIQASLRRVAIECSTEKFVRSVDASSHEAFVRLGLSDAVSAKLGEDGRLVFTDDLDLSVYLQHRRIDCVHYTSMLRPQIL